MNLIVTKNHLVTIWLEVIVKTAWKSIFYITFFVLYPAMVECIAYSVVDMQYILDMHYAFTKLQY